MGPPENPTRHREKQEARARKRPVRRPRARQCLLKGCERRFHPRHARQRYCSERVPGGGAGVVGVEGPAELPGHGGGQTEAQRAKPALPEARQRAKTA